MKKVLVSDYDKTFYLNDEDIERNKIAVEKFRKEGNIFVIATGRSYYDIKKKIKEYKINYDYLIINHIILFTIYSLSHFRGNQRNKHRWLYIQACFLYRFSHFIFNFFRSGVVIFCHLLQ